MARVFPNFLKGFLQFTSESEAPEPFNFWTGVSTMAGALRRHVWVEQGRFQWSPNFYIIFVARAGIATKSTAMGEGMKLLEQVKDVQFGPDSLTWQALGMSLQKSVDIIKLQGDDGPKLATSPLTIAASELGTLLKLEDAGLADMLTAMWDGQLAKRAFKHSTVSRDPIEIMNPWLNIIGCTTPAWMQQHFPEHLIGAGLTSRIIFVYADKKKKLVPYPGKAWRGKTVLVQGREFTYSDLEQGLVLDLQHIATLKGEMKLSVEAEEWGEAWYYEHLERPPKHLRSERYDGYRSRKQAHMHKLAMILSIAERDDLLITDLDLKMADAILTSVEPHMIKVFDSIGKVPEARHVDKVVHVLSNYGITMTLEEVFALVSNQMSQQDYQEAIKSGMQAGLITGQSLVDPDTGQKVRKIRLSPFLTEPSVGPGFVPPEEQ